MSVSDPAEDSRVRGMAAGALAYAVWGLSPLFWKGLTHVPAIDTVGWRVAMTSVFVTGLVLYRRDGPAMWERMRSPRALASSLLCALLIATNWGVYVWAIVAERVTEASLGYFMNPLINVVLGVAVLKETLRRGQWLAVGLAAVGVLWLTVWVGSLPWVALVLASTFATYGLLRKTMSAGPLLGLSLEMMLLCVPALGLLLLHSDVDYLADSSPATLGLLICTGVITAVPLLLFAMAARAIPLTVLGLLQYLAPTLQFVLGVFYYDEPFGVVQFAGYLFVWLGLLVFVIEGVSARASA